MKITADTNVLIRSLIGDHPAQASASRAALSAAESIAIPTLALCEIAWVLRRVYRRTAGQIADSIRSLLSDPKVVVDDAATAAGLAMLDAGGGFADGIIAYEGRRLGGDVLMTFDRKAARLIIEQGGKTYLLDAI